MKNNKNAPTSFDPSTIERPDPLLMRYYFYCALLTGPGFPFALLGFWMRYITLRYKFDADGVSVSYGVFFRREVNLTFRRIQDIHLTHNLLQRWMRLAKISLQTAAGSAQAEMVIEGVLEAEALRDYLYSRMRGARDDLSGGSPIANVQPAMSAQIGTATSEPSLVLAANSHRTLQTLIEIRDAMQVIAHRLGDKS